MTMTVLEFHLSARGSCIPILMVLLLLSWTDSYRHHPLYRLTYALGRCHQYDDTHKINTAVALHVGRYKHSKLIHVFAAVSLIGGHSNSASSATDASVAIVSTTNITTTIPSHATQQSSTHSLKVRIQWFQSQIQRNNIQSFISLFKHYRDEVDITYYSLLIDEYYIGPDDISYALTRLLPSMNRGMISTFCEQVLFFQRHSTYMLQVLDTQALTATMSSLNK